MDHKAFLMKLRPVLLITRREVRDQFRDWRVLFPVLGLTLFFPFLMNFTAQQLLGFVRQYGANIIGERLVPFLLMIVGFFPISVSLVIALETFVGEKERGSIEPLLNSPMEDWQLYLGKLLAATVPPLFSSYLGMAVYLSGLVINHIPIPELAVLLQIFSLTTIQALMMVAGAVVVSSQATSVRAANLLASFIIIPSALLIQGESIVFFWGDFSTLWWAVFGIFILTILLARVGLAHFNREELLGREIDVLNFRWMRRTFWQGFTGGARGVKDWFFKAVPAAVREMRWAVLIISLVTLVSVYLGYRQADRFYFDFQASSLDNVNEGVKRLYDLMPALSVQSLMMIFWQNVRVMILAMILGALSMGIIGVMPLVASMGVTGYLMALLQGNGIPIIQYLALILPHGIVEIPAAILATAAVFQAGAVLATPTSDRTVGEVWLISLAKWARIMVGLVIPLLLIASAIEAWVTPRIAILIFS
jgi:uncharacterized membrane protein SpoIIM required for sporulation/ABC-type transport system involved in multi-copper enzyme maturation permease subunit